MSTTPICPCDASTPALASNLPGLSQIAFRVGDFNDFRRALLTPLLNTAQQPPNQPLEQSLTAWQPGQGADPSVADLAVMMVEWWAYLADILTFYNERIANEDYLRTALLPETPAQLVRILGYRPRPAIGAQGILAALATPSVLPTQTVTLPAGLQFQSKPGPGGAPQTFELTTATPIGQPGVVPAIPPPNLIADLESYWFTPLETAVEKLEASVHVDLASAATPHLRSAQIRAPQAQSKSSTQPLVKQTGTTGHGQSPLKYENPEIQLGFWIPLYGLLVQGTVTTLSASNLLLLGTRDDNATPSLTPFLIGLHSPPAFQTVSGGRKQTVLTFTTSNPPPAMQAASSRLTKANQSAALWTANPGAIAAPSASQTQIHLASLARQIRPNDWVLLSAPSLGAYQLFQVASVLDVLGDASSGGSPAAVAPQPAITDATGAAVPGVQTTTTLQIPVLHTRLTLAGALASFSTDSDPSTITVLFNWAEVGTLVDQPPSLWDGTSATLNAIQPAQFPATAVSPAPILMADSNGNGQAASASGSGSQISVVWPTGVVPPLSPELQPPLNLYYNLLSVTQGKTVANEILGSGDGTVAGQSFMLSKSPVTYLMNGATYASTITLTVNGQPWTEVVNFYNRAANAQVFVTREDSSQNTWVDFGDGVNGARLPTGSNNVVCTYRIGAGASSPPAGKLTVIAQSYPGLQSIVNPVAVAGGSDPDPAALLKQYAPRSVLAFGRAVSVFDYQALAAQAPGVTMASAIWSWDKTNLRGGVTVYVAGEANIFASVQTQLDAAGDPNRPITVQQATPLPVTLNRTLIVTPGMDSNAILANVITALCDPSNGLFSPAHLGIGQALFDSQIDAACLGVDGVVAITGSGFAFPGSAGQTSPYVPGEGNYFSLDPATFQPGIQTASQGTS